MSVIPLKETDEREDSRCSGSWMRDTMYKELEKERAFLYVG